MDTGVERGQDDVFAEYTRCLDFAAARRGLGGESAGAWGGRPESRPVLWHGLRPHDAHDRWWSNLGRRLFKESGWRRLDEHRVGCDHKLRLSVRPIRCEPP